MKKKNKEKKVNAKDTFGITMKTSKYLFYNVWNEQRGKVFVLIKGLMALLNSIFPLVATIFPGLLINELTGEQRLYILGIYVMILLLTPALSIIINVTAGHALTKLSMFLGQKFEADFYRRVGKMDYDTMENPNITSLRERASEVAMNNFLDNIDHLCALGSAVLSLLVISSIIVSLNPLVILLIVCTIYVNSIITKWLNRKKFEIQKKMQLYRREKWMHTYVFDGPFFGKEVRLFNLCEFIISKLINSNSKINELELESSNASNKSNLFFMGTNLIQQLSIYLYLMYCVIKNGLPVGNMTIFLSATGQFTSSLNSVMNSYLRMSQDSLKVQQYIDFMNIPLKQYRTGDKHPSFTKNSIIEFKNVSFKYPGSERYAIHNINLIIRGNEKLGIVGENGAGKSTFIKLLTRLYFPSEGEILLDGVNINEYDYEQYQKLFAPVFQDFGVYELTVGDNIVLSDVYNKQRLDKVCTESGLSSLIRKLPKGYNTFVGKNLDPEGIQLSGGEAQRMAIARARYHDGEIFLLDEPTAAFDPNAEYEVYSQFNNMIADKCAVIITHRLSAVQLVDKIAVFDNGNVIEYGTHKELYNKSGVYTEMFDKQAQFYRDEKKNDVV